MEAMIETPVHWLYCTTEGWHANTPHRLCYQLGLQFLHLLLPQVMSCSLNEEDKCQVFQYLLALEGAGLVDEAVRSSRQYQQLREQCQPVAA